MPNASKTYRPDVLHVVDLNRGRWPLSPNDPSYKWRILAEGDSWFSLGAIPSSNLLYELRFKKRTVILNLGRPGDTITNISALSDNAEFSRRLAHPRYSSDWDAILLSGGGNDLIDWADEIIKKKPRSGGRKVADYVNEKALKALGDKVVRGYADIVAHRDSRKKNRNKPIIVHTYDYPTPRPSPATFLIMPITDPWLHPIFESKKTPMTMRIKITDHLMDSLATTLHDLESRLTAFHVVETRGVLHRAALGDKGNSGDWLNEIHPNDRGYRKIANRIGRRLHRLLR
jgi:lysophospholipase L1-like esterase